MFYFNGEPVAGDIYGDGWMKSPVKLKAGLNEILIRCGQFLAGKVWAHNSSSIKNQFSSALMMSHCHMSCWVNLRRN